MQSPVREVRQRLSMSAPEFARICGISNAALNFVERGTAPIPAKALGCLQRLGVDTDALQDEHAVFLEQRLQELQQQALQATANYESSRNVPQE